MSPLVRSGRLCLFTGLIALAALGCSQNLENNEQYQAQVSHLERMDEDLKSAQKTIARMETEFQQAAKEIVALKAAVGSGRAAGAPGGAAADATLKALEQRLIVLESQARKTAASPAAPAPGASRAQATAMAPAAAPEADVSAPAGASKTVTPKMRGAAAPAAKPTRSSQVAVVAKPAGTKAAAGVAKKKAARPAATPTPKAESASASSGSGGGTYYTVGPNDTIAEIAVRHNLSPNSVLAANRLPSNVRLYAGQTLFIPRKSKIYN